jgi:choline kinase
MSQAGSLTESSNSTKGKPQSLTRSVRSHFRVHNPSPNSGGSSSESEAPDTVPHIARSLDRSLSGDSFKKAIVLLLYELGVPQWRSVPIEVASLISVRRISGALTNSIYQVALPSDVERFRGYEDLFPRAAPKLLLRVYGAHVEHLIDRNHELIMLKRLSSHHIGPLLLGTFANGRFEQWLDSHTLSQSEFRDPSLSCCIARCMRELHDSVKLTSVERHSLPSVWTSLDKWFSRARDIIIHRRRKLTGRLSDQSLPALSKSRTSGRAYVMVDSWSNDLILGQRWTAFEVAVAQYRLHMEELYPPEKLKRELAFCHNDVCGFSAKLTL